MFSKNGYPAGFVEKIYKSLTRSEKSINSGDGDDSSGVGVANSDDGHGDEDEISVVLKLPYMGILSTKFGRRIRTILEESFTAKLRVVYQSCKVGRYFGLKDKTPFPYSSNAVYKFTCSEDGDKSYIGVTSRQLFVRVSEHFNPTRLSAVQDHVSGCRSCQQMTNPIDRFEVCRICSDSKEAEVAEAMFIQELRPALNKQLGEHKGCSFLLKVFK